MNKMSDKRDTPLWRRNEKIDKKTKILILGSFTSRGGYDRYFYGSDKNNFWYLLDYALFSKNMDINISTMLNTSENRKIVKEEIAEKGTLVKVKNELCRHPNDENREKLHALLLENNIDITDIYRRVEMRTTNTDNDSDIILPSHSTYTKYNIDVIEEALKNRDIKIILTTSKYVLDHFNEMTGHKYKAQCLPAPTSRGKKGETLFYKLSEWKKAFNNN